MNKLPSGRELDALVAEKAMGITNAVSSCPVCGSEDLRRHWLTEQDCCSKCELNLNFQNRYVIPKSYSTDIAAAWEVKDWAAANAPNF